jgi:HlyD family secretion protein
VLVLDDTNHVHRINVQLGGRDGEWIEVVEGLSGGQRVVGSGAAFLQDGELVRILQPTAPAAETEGNSAASGEDIRGRER